MRFGSHGGVYERYYLLGCDAVWYDTNLQTIRRNVQPQSSGLTILLDAYLLA
jgi:hypothetical protein